MVALSDLILCAYMFCALVNFFIVCVILMTRDKNDPTDEFCKIKWWHVVAFAVFVFLSFVAWLSVALHKFFNIDKQNKNNDTTNSNQKISR